MLGHSASVLLSVVHKGLASFRALVTEWLDVGRVVGSEMRSDRVLKAFYCGMPFVK